MAKRDQAAMIAAQRDSDISKVCQVLELQSLMDNLSEDVRVDFLNGTNGAVVSWDHFFIILAFHLSGCWKKNYAEMFGGEMRMNASIMRKTHWVILKFQQLTKLKIKPFQWTRQQWNEKHFMESFKQFKLFVMYYMHSYNAYHFCWLWLLLLLFMVYFDKRFIIYTVSL